MKFFAVVCTTLLLITFLPLLHSATPASGTLGPSASGGASSITWSGGPFTAVTADPAFCTPLSCDNYALTVLVPATFYASNPDYSVRVRITWASTPNDFDLYVYDDAGNLVNSSAQGGTTFEEVDLGQPTSANFRVQVVAFSTLNEPYSGTASLAPHATENVRLAKYKKGSFSFTPPKQLTGPDGLAFGVQDIEPRAAFDPAGNIYVAAIQGVPAGTDVWKSTDGGISFSYLGQPDGAQAASAMFGRTPGVGGGDEDIAIGPDGRIIVSSLWIGAVTTSTSVDGGGTWVANPISSNVPLDDRQWIATHGANEVYLTFQQLGIALSGTNSIFVMKSFDGGVTFPQITEATTPEFGIQPEIQGNIDVDQSSGNVYTVFVAHPGNTVCIERSTNGGLSFSPLTVYTGPTGASFANVFPIIGVDNGGNLHTVFSDGSNVLLASSSNAGATWTTPVRVNNGTDTKTAIAPWIDAGDAGKVDIMWWATSAANNLDANASWKVFFAQTQNALARTPTIVENPATGVFHIGPICVNGTACASGTRNLAEYASTTVYRDGGGLIVYPDDHNTSNPLTYFVRQSSGTVITSATQAKAAAETPASHPAAEPAPQRAPDKPLTYTLEQNAPNPFNPSTIIRYALPRESFVSLKVYTLLGEELSTLVDETQSAGVKSVRFDAGNLPSGMYFYRLQAGPFVEVRKMVLMR